MLCAWLSWVFSKCGLICVSMLFLCMCVLGVKFSDCSWLDMCVCSVIVDYVFMWFIRVSVRFRLLWVVVFICIGIDDFVFVVGVDVFCWVWWLNR